MIRMVWYTNEDVSILRFSAKHFVRLFREFKTLVHFEVGGSFSELCNVNGFSNFWFTNS